MRIRQLITIAAMSAMTILGACSYDDSVLDGRIDKLESRVTILESTCTQLNSDVKSLQEIVKALESGDYVTGLVQTSDGSRKGWTISFAKASPVTIWDGKDGESPVLAIRQDTDGKCYWTIDGEYALVDGKKVPASAEDGITPTMKVDGGRWFISYDEGKNWTYVGEAVASECKKFTSVTEDKDYVTITFAGGSTVRLSKKQPLTLTLSKTKSIPVAAGSTVRIKYTVSGSDPSTELDVIADGGWKATMTRIDQATGTIDVNAPDPFTEGKVAVIASNASGETVVKFMTFREPEPKDPDEISILAIGNSFSVDAMQYLYGMLKELGYNKIRLGNLYIGGCTLETHAKNLDGDIPAYTYYTNTTGTWNTASATKASSAIESYDWDYITVQQASGYSGMPDSFDPYLSNVITAAQIGCPTAKICWHMTWAYQGNSTHSDFGKYQSSQSQMYSSILGAVHEKVESNSAIKGIIPCGTAVQNMRTSYIGDNVTRDGYHMSYSTGRYLTALTWARFFTGKDISGLTYVPSGYTFTKNQIAAAKEAVDNAIANPWEVTESSYGKKDPNYVSNTELREVLRAARYNPDGFDEYPYRTTRMAYYYSSSKASISNALPSPSTLLCAENGSTASNLKQFAATGIFTEEDLPVGTVIVLKEGYAFRPEGWTGLNTLNASADRPGNQSSPQITVIDSEWWSKFNYRAFNLSKSGVSAPTETEMDEICKCIAIFIPRPTK